MRLLQIEASYFLRKSDLGIKNRERETGISEDGTINPHTAKDQQPISVFPRSRKPFDRARFSTATGLARVTPHHPNALEGNHA
jgi:hypothetical protein